MTYNLEQGVLGLFSPYSSVLYFYYAQNIGFFFHFSAIALFVRAIQYNFQDHPHLQP
jgi:hypothetical protein